MVSSTTPENLQKMNPAIVQLQMLRQIERALVLRWDDNTPAHQCATELQRVSTLFIRAQGV